MELNKIKYFKTQTIITKHFRTLRPKQVSKKSWETILNKILKGLNEFPKRNNFFMKQKRRNKIKDSLFFLRLYEDFILNIK